MASATNPEVAGVPQPCPPQFFCAKLLSRTSAALYLGISPSKLSQLVDRGEITRKQLDGKPLYLREDLDEYAESLPDKERA